MDPSQNAVPSPNVPPRADPEIGTTMPLPPMAGGSVQGGPIAAGAAQAAPSAPPAAPPAALPNILPPTVPVGQGAEHSPNSGQQGQNSSQSGSARPASPVSVPAAADNGDLIEKTWVLKAKQIVERTRLDPHEQTKQLQALKADYMKKRYNKTIGQVDD